MRKSPLHVYFDFISPYAYLGWTQVGALAARHGREVEPIPVLFAALLDHYGHRGPAEIPPKRMYVFKNVLRRAADLGLALVPPPSHPFNPLLALRVASLPLARATRQQIIDRLFAGAWSGLGGVEGAEQVTQLLDELGLDGAALVEEACAPESKARLREQTETALREGVFGVPTIIADGELFWGFDAYPDLERFLRGEDPIDHGALGQWIGLPVSAQRAAGARTPDR